MKGRVLQLDAIFQLLGGRPTKASSESADIGRSMIGSSSALVQSRVVSWISSNHSCIGSLSHHFAFGRLESYLL